jgi:universal stress protein A
MSPKRILFSTDFSENSEPALNLALEQVKAFQGELLILHVVDSWAGFPSYQHGVCLNVQEVVQSCLESAQARLDQMVEELGKVTNGVKTYSRIGVPAQEIARLADEESVDMIVMGTHGWTGLRHMLLGSVAENVLRTAKCPVLVVRSRH